MGQHGLVRGGAKGDHAGPERRLEPAAMLVAALEIEVGGPLGAALAALESRRVAGPGVEPYVERVAAAHEGGGRRPAGGERDAFEDFFRGAVVPEIRAQLFELGRDGARHAGIEEGLLLRVV